MSNHNIIQDTIVKQLGGFGRLRAMVGAHGFVADDDNKALHFQFKGSRKSKKCIITLDPNDTYTMELGRVFKGQWKSTYKESGLYWDMLKPVFEQETGLYLSL